MIEHTRIDEPQSGWRVFWKSVGYTVAAIALVALGFFGAMAVSGYFA